MEKTGHRGRASEETESRRHSRRTNRALRLRRHTELTPRDLLPDPQRPRRWGICWLAPVMEKLCGYGPAQNTILSLENQCLATLPEMKAMGKPRGHVSGRPDILSLENRCLTTLPDLTITEKLHGQMSGRPEILSLEKRCLTTCPDLKPTEKLHGHMSAHADILSLENGCLATLPVLQSTVSTTPFLQSHQRLLEAHLCRLNTNNYLLSEPPTWRTQCLSERPEGLTCSRVLKFTSTLESAAAEEAASGLCSSPEEEKKTEETKWTDVQMPFYSLSLGEEEEEVEEFALKLTSGDSDSCLEKTDQALQEKKMVLVSLLCTTVVSCVKSTSNHALLEACREIANLEPEFILKASLYTRQQLNIRDEANKVLAIAASLPACRPHLRRYFCAIVQLPSDWIQVAEFYQVWMALISTNFGPHVVSPLGSLHSGTRFSHILTSLQMSSPLVPRPDNLSPGYPAGRIRLTRVRLWFENNQAYSGFLIYSEEKKNKEVF